MLKVYEYIQYGGKYCGRPLSLGKSLPVCLGIAVLLVLLVGVMECIVGSLFYLSMKGVAAPSFIEPKGCWINQTTALSVRPLGQQQITMGKGSINQFPLKLRTIDEKWN